MYPSRTYIVMVAYSSTSDVVGSYMTGVLGSRACIWMYVARHLEDQELWLVRLSLS